MAMGCAAMAAGSDRHGAVPSRLGGPSDDPPDELLKVLAESSHRKRQRSRRRYFRAKTARITRVPSPPPDTRTLDLAAAVVEPRSAVAALVSASSKRPGSGSASEDSGLRLAPAPTSTDSGVFS